jgi:transposase
LHGVRPPGRALLRTEDWQDWLARIESKELAEALRILWIGFEATARQVRLARRQMMRLSRSYKIIGCWQQWPGMGPVRAVTLLAYLDTPWRFRSPKALWKYCGLGLQRTQSGTDARGRSRPGKLKLAWQCNHRLKDVVIGAALSAIVQGDNRFAEDYQRMVQGGMSPSNARHGEARKMLSVLWGQWKNLERDSSGREEA